MTLVRFISPDYYFSYLQEWCHYIFFIGLTLVSNAKINMLIWTEGKKMTAPSDDICYKKRYVHTLFKRPNLLSPWFTNDINQFLKREKMLMKQGSRYQNKETGKIFFRLRRKIEFLLLLYVIKCYTWSLFSE